MTGVDIAASVSEAGGESPLPTGAAETGDSSLADGVGSFFEALAAQSDEQPSVVVFSRAAGRSELTDGGPGPEPSGLQAAATDSEPSPIELVTVVPDVGPEVEMPEVSPPIQDPVARVPRFALVGDSGDTRGQVIEPAVDEAAQQIDDAPPLDADRARKAPFAGQPGGKSVEVDASQDETHGAPDRPPADVDPDPDVSNISRLPPGVRLEAAQSELPSLGRPLGRPVTTPETPGGESPGSAAPAQTSAVSGTAQKTARRPVPGTGASGSGKPVLGRMRSQPMPDMPLAVPTSAPALGSDQSAAQSAAESPQPIDASDGHAANVATASARTDGLAGPRHRPDAAPEPVSSRDETADLVNPVRPTPVFHDPATPDPERHRSDVDKTCAKDRVTAPPTPDRPSAVDLPAGRAEMQASDERVARLNRAVDRLGTGASDRSTALPAITLAATQIDTPPEESPTLSRLLRSALPSFKAEPQHMQVTATPLTTPIMVVLPGVDSASTHPDAALPTPAGLGAAQWEQISISTGMGLAEAWRYEEVARLLDEAGHARHYRTPAVTATVTPLEAVSDWAGAAVRSAFDPPALPDPEQLDLPDQLVRGIRMQWRNGAGEATIRLTPEHLGEVLVSLQVRQGSVSAVLRADSDIVRAWIRAHQHELRSSLEAQGLHLGELTVEEDGHADPQSGRDFDRPRRRSPRQTSGARFEVRV